MDCEMPIMNGFEATIELKRMMIMNEISYVPIIACTAFVGDDQKEKCFHAGMKGFMNKPVVLENLGNTLNSCGVIPNKI